MDNQLPLCEANPLQSEPMLEPRHAMHITRVVHSVICILSRTTQLSTALIPCPVARKLSTRFIKPHIAGSGAQPFLHKCVSSALWILAAVVHKRAKIFQSAVEQPPVHRPCRSV
ncbi:hypothetical protein, unlikely [Trypanosoma brucei gambiense DAL972]|uniref:Uncharacterized protein n=1 Tax=Trypanosoma brucei gambiense (strain MHOM/CI/86/DAL972) TaxID=679716 RepID=C9ZV38_TRYB9|nr:hypothetical protein, unlikely [Trypanosoma brucei gambiense DAL972]CBH13276.1 hypothetical protein, unlikely [Trypanosoma brucei gambiense DAL972]|eukprot:XP_011775553.1 hypothetical protein, unlikely [Trypanosoma brucei gambiense DAL972]